MNACFQGKHTITGFACVKRFSKKLEALNFEKRSTINSVWQRFSLNLIQIKRKTL